MLSFEILGSATCTCVACVCAYTCICRFVRLVARIEENATTSHLWILHVLSVISVLQYVIHFSGECTCTCKGDEKVYNICFRPGVDPGFQKRVEVWRVGGEVDLWSTVVLLYSLTLPTWLVAGRHFCQHTQYKWSLLCPPC